MTRGLMGAVLYAKDVDRLVQFYASVMDLEVQTVEKGFAILGCEPTRLVIVRIPRRIADEIEITAPPEPREETPIKLVFALDDIAHARNRAAGLGGALGAIESEWEFDGARICDGHDPEGNIFQIRQPG